MTGGDIMGIVYENEIIHSHRILVPPNVYGTVTKVSFERSEPPTTILAEEEQVVIDEDEEEDDTLVEVSTQPWMALVCVAVS